ncbi:basic proline-rich protein-like [Cuculus canorus]|uniref:basic proline-rich protein-like n=1 Tax=Cuculus canorus TaxID=55661 RepID=UPI0023AAD212|nr:basic proline-rich protein-like [Cuculus canorus]
MHIRSATSRTAAPRCASNRAEPPPAGIPPPLQPRDLPFPPLSGGRARSNPPILGSPVPGGGKAGSIPPIPGSPVPGRGRAGSIPPVPGSPVPPAQTPLPRGGRARSIPPIPCSPVHGRSGAGSSPPIPGPPVPPVHTPLPCRGRTGSIPPIPASPRSHRPAPASHGAANLRASRALGPVEETPPGESRRGENNGAGGGISQRPCPISRSPFVPAAAPPGSAGRRCPAPSRPAAAPGQLQPPARAPGAALGGVTCEEKEPARHLPPGSRNSPARRSHSRSCRRREEPRPLRLRQATRRAHWLPRRPGPTPFAPPRTRIG